MASAVVPAVRDRWPHAHITWVAGRRIAQLVRRFDGVDAVIEVDEDALLVGGLRSRASELLRTWRRVGRGYDRAIIAHADWRYAALAWWSGATRVRRAPLGRRMAGSRWHGDTYALLAANQGEPGPTERTARYAGVCARRGSAAALMTGDGPLVVISPGGARNALRDDGLRRWPIEKWEQLTAHLVAQGLRVAAVGGATDHVETARCAAAGATDLAGATDVESLYELILSAQAVISHDSGVLHLALLAARPAVALFGPTPPSWFIPPGAQATVVSAAATLACAPCYDGFAYARCERNACVADVDVMQVAHAVHAYLSPSWSPPS